MAETFKLINPNYTLEIVKSIYQDYANDVNDTRLAEKYKMPRPTIHRLTDNFALDKTLEFPDGTLLKPSDLPTPKAADIEIVTENVRLAKARQKQMDFNRVERKSFRDYARIENSSDEYAKSLLTLLEANKWHDPEFVVKSNHQDTVGIIQLSDLHFNEEINIAGNVFNFKTASARLKFFIEQRAIPLFKARGVKTVLIAMTGDLLNSDRRLEELMCNSHNRAKATFLAVDILQQIVRVVSSQFQTKVLHVVGNESRATEKIAWSNAVASDNYDCTIFNWLKSLFAASKKVEFLTGDESEFVVDIAGKNVLFVHGHGFTKDLDTGVAKTRARYAAKGTCIDFVICGHVHSARLSDTYARSSSLSGPNAYSERGLNCTGRASQNLFVVSSKGGIDGYVVDLHAVPLDDYYEYESSLESYNSNAQNKLRHHDNIIKIVV